MYAAGTAWTTNTNTSRSISWQQASAVTKLTAAGGPVWATTFGTGSTAYGIGVDAAGTVYVTGRFAVTVDFDPGEADTTTVSPGSTRTSLYVVQLRQG